MAIVTMTAVSESISDFNVIRTEVPLSIIEESFWSAQYAFRIPTCPQSTDRMLVICLFQAEEAYYLSHDRRILPLLSETFPPYPLGCLLWIREKGALYQVDMPKYPYLRLCKQGDRVKAEFVVRDRYGSGLILWGAHKLKKSPVAEQICIRLNRLRSLKEAVWLEPYPNGARSVICLTDHPDFDSVAKLRLLSELFSQNNFRITKGVFPNSDPGLGRTEPGIDVSEYKHYINVLYESGSEVAYHGLSPRRDAPPLSECLRRIDMMGEYSPKTWIDHGVGDYLFSRNAVFKEGPSLLEVLDKVGIENYWSYTDVWENPARDLHVWTKRKPFIAFSNMLYFLWDIKRVSAPLLIYYGSSVLKNLLGPLHLRPIMNAPWSMGAWKSVVAQARSLKYCHGNPMVLYNMSGQCSFMGNEKIWIFDTILLNHMAFQLRPQNIDSLCKHNGMLLAHCYLGHQKNKYGTKNCFVDDGANPALIPEFVENIKYISEKQSQKEVATLSFSALREALTDFATASLVRTENGWVINCRKVVVASYQALSFSRPVMQWCKENVHYSEVAGRVVAQRSGLQ